MRKLIVIAHVTLDGITQGPGGPEEDTRDGFTSGGWAMRHGDEAVTAALRAMMARPFDLLLGRRTYEIFAAYWPHAGESFIGKPFNAAAKYVVTRSLSRLEWANSHALRGDVVGDVRTLKETDGPELHLWGSGVLLQTLVAADLVDEYRLWIYPVILGRGKRLFEAGVPPTNLELVATTTGSRGVVLTTYRRGHAQALA